MSTAMNNHAKSNSVVSAPNPSITNFLSNNGINSRVKQEKQDDPEIRELAAKLVEANKAKMAVPQKNSPSGQPPGMNILNYLGSDKNKNSSNNPLANSIQELKEIDEESSKGRFGWTLMGKTHIPYIIRSGENYVAVRMVELKVLNKWLNYLHQDLYNCTNIRSYYITEAEARLLNEINLKHCDYQFGREQFTQRDLIVRLADSNEFYQFLGHCYHKLVNNVENDMPNRCGFIRINRESVVPYTVYNDQKYVPLFYFEGETDNLKQRADKLEGWDLSYLKFCCKVQGIRNELFAHDSCSVISLNDIKNYFPPGTIFEDYWPKKNLDSTQLLVSGRNNAMPQNVHWTRQPAAPPMAAHPPPSPKPATQAKAASNGPLHHVYANNYGIAGGQPSYHSAQTRAASAAVRTTYPPAASTRHIRPSGGFYGTLSQAPPPPLVRSGTINQYNSSQKTQATANNYMVVDPQNNYTQAQGTYPPPPPMLQHINGTISRYDVANTYSTTRPIDMTQSPNPLINQNPAHQSSGRTQTSSDTNLVLANGRSSLSVATATKNKLINLPECSPPLNATSNIPYKIQKAQVQGKMLTLINMKSYVYSEHLITLQDLITNFFNGVPMQNCQQVLQVLGIDVFKANPSQVQVLLENNKCSSRNETIPLVQVRNVIDYMPQLKYMLSSKVAEVPAKRQRNS
ncbi:uncharacterized protein LOC126748107 isoform X2 [Anthonomus grandis grandis]|uniref:uncharacterized protein LOC126748107 isoform X2 n=1 Tax=Anthonomus grandis grandis TaxID=2921223 RepID=UPI002165870E|nr:uncharacterized protein LOC126748107 isoform X2 [Anthonomus grandis grandis]